MRTQFPLTVIAIVLSFAASLPAQAQRARVFVSVNGVDSGQCQATAPCRTFAFAESAVLAGGEISVLNTGGYGTLTITKALSIVAPAGVEASIAIPSGGTGIVISAGSTDAVSLRGLTLDGTGVGQAGIVFNGGQSLTVEGCVVRNMKQDGLDFLSFTATTTQRLAVSNSYFSDNGGIGMLIATEDAGGINAAIDRTGFSSNNTGLQVQSASGSGFVVVAVTDSVAANSSTGFLVASATSSLASLSLTHSLVEGNDVGVINSGSNAATLWLAQSTLMGNNLGFAAVGVINSFGDNYFATNNGNSGSLTSVSRQ